MDVKQFAFLNRQRSAAIQPRESFCGLPKRGLALLLANVMFWQPMWAQAAEGIVVSAPGTALNQAGNGVPIVNIAAPNGSGLSHNQFVDYNVGSNGVILNNATDRTQETQLGGIILGNPHLQGTAATTILNEVNGGNPSQLRGYTEVAGQSAKVIVANPYGISCNGCGFINTPQVTLTTGKPVINAQGAVGGYQVDGGSVSLEGAGLNAGNVGRFDIITRSAKLNAQLHAQELNVITGRNDVDAQTLAATPRAGAANDAPALAIDSSALGGMYAGAIKLVGTEAGVGVRLAGDLIASGGDIQLDANGHVSLAQTSATGAVNVKAASLDVQGPLYGESKVQVTTTGNLTNQNNIAARDSITLNAGGTLSNRGVIEAGVEKAGTRNTQGDITVTAQNLDNTGKTMVASRDLAITTRETLNNQGGTLSAQRTGQIDAGTLDNRQQGRVISAGTQTINSGELLNDQGGLVSSEQALTVVANTLSNRGGELSTRSDATLHLGQLDNSDAGKVLATQALTLRIANHLNNQAGLIDANTLKITAASLFNRQGSLHSIGDLTLQQSGLLDNQAGKIVAGQQARLELGRLDNQNKGHLEAKSGLQLTTGELLNQQGGRVFSETGLTLDLKRGQLNNQAGLIAANGPLVFQRLADVDNRGGEISSAQSFMVQADNLDNSAGKVLSEQAVTLRIAQALSNIKGRIAAAGIDLHSGSLDNQGGTLASRAGQQLQVQNALNNRLGEISAAGQHRLAAGSLNNQQGRVLSDTELFVELGAALDNQAGVLGAASLLDIKAHSLDNRAKGSLASDDQLKLSLVDALDNRSGSVAALGMLHLDAGRADNRAAGLIGSGQSSTLRVGELDNRGGEISAEKGIDGAGQVLDNSGGKLLAGTTLGLVLEQLINHNKGLVSAQQISLDGARLDNSGGVVSARERLEIRLHDRGLPARDGRLDNQQGHLESEGALLLETAQIDNRSGAISSTQQLTLKASAEIDNREGTLESDAGLSLASGRLDNRQGVINNGLDASLDTGRFDNQQGRLSSAGRLQLKAGQVNNSDKGRIASGQALDVRVTGLEQQNGELYSTGDLSLDLQHGHLNNQGGLIHNSGILTLKQLKDVANQGGEISSDQAFTLAARQLDTSAGKVLSKQALTLTLEQALTSLKGQILAASLTVRAASLDNSAGLISSRGVLDIDLGAQGGLVNQAGTLFANGNLLLRSNTLNNHQGHVASQQDLDVRGGVIDNQAGELIAEGGLTVAGQRLDNRAKGLVKAAKDATLTVDDIDNRDGEITSKGSIALTGNSLDNSDQGRVRADRALDLGFNQVHNRNKGELSAKQALTLTGTGPQSTLDNSAGRLSSDGPVKLNLSGEVLNIGGRIDSESSLVVSGARLDNSGGTLSSATDLTLDSQGQVLNQRGKLLGDGNLKLTSASLDNREDGVVTAKGQVVLKTGELDNSQRGRVIAGTTLDLTATQLRNNDAGQIAGKTLLASVTGLEQQGGKLFGADSLTLDLNNGDLDNQGGTLNSPGLLLIKQLRDLYNRGGEISSSQQFSLLGRTLNNSGGSLISHQQLNLDASQLINAKGLVSGWQGVRLDGTSVDNSDGGTVSSRDGTLVVELDGALRNGQGGALASLGELKVTAASLDNRGGVLASGAGQHLVLTKGALDNSAGGLLDSKAGIYLQAAGLNNSDARLIGKGPITLVLDADLNNSRGKLLSGAALNVDKAGQVINHGGQLGSQTTLTLHAQGVDNSQRGTLAAVGDLLINSKGEVRNSEEGLLHSESGVLKIDAGSLDNTKGKLQSLTDITLDTRGAIVNQNGQIIAQRGDVGLTAGSLNNRNGVLASLKGALTAQINGGLLSNQGGVIQARQLTLTALAGLHNQGGRLASQAGQTSIHTGEFINQGGGVYANGLISVTANRVDNSFGGQIAGQNLSFGLGGALYNRGGVIESDTALSLVAGSFDNQGGQLRAMGKTGKTEFRIGGLLDNLGGVLETSNTDLALNAGNFLNGGGRLLHGGQGDFGVSLANLSGAGGELATLGGLTISAANWSTNSVIQAGRLTVNVGQLTVEGAGRLLASQSFVGTGGNWVNNGLIASDGAFSLNLGGSYSGTGRATSLGDLKLDANSIVLGASTSIAGGGTTTIGGLGTLASLTNYGRLTSAQALDVRASRLDNWGTLASGTTLKISSGAAQNNANAFIFSGTDMTWSVSSLTNLLGEIYSLGNLNVEGLSPGTRAAVLKNMSGKMESARDFIIKAEQISNERNNFSVTSELYSSAVGQRCYSCTSLPYGVSSSKKTPWHLVWVQQYKTTVSGDPSSVAASLNAGGNLDVQGSNFKNANSTVSATGNIAITVGNFENTGAALGDYISAKYLSVDARGYGQLDQLIQYNQYNDAAYNKDWWFINPNGEVSRAPTITYRCCATPSESYVAYGMLVFAFKDGHMGARDMGPSLYSTGQRMELPAFVANAAVFDEKVIATGTATSYVPAVIQAGGNVSINATQKLGNGVEKPFTAPNGFGGRGTNTGATSAQPILIDINKQLPPDLAQQQVNPLALPGFSLPTGQNGLFRLSTSEGAVSVPSSSGWTLGGSSINLAERDRPLPITPGRDSQLGNLPQVDASVRAVDPTQRERLELDTRATSVALDNTGNGSGRLPERNTDAAGLTALDPLALTKPAPWDKPKVVPPTSIRQVQGLPDNSGRSQPHKYLIETNPVLTDLKSFMSSDYLLGNLGYDPDKSWKRLGDGFYEQRLIQDAVVARTGQRFIDGQTSNEALYKYLMDNAIASKQRLDLSVGVTLTAQQVTALTHDIVWLEEHVVNGEKVLVPVLYLAQANNRLAPNGALIAGNDVTLVAGDSLSNVGTIKANNNLSASAGKNLVNGGLLEAGNRLDMLAGDSILNGAGGIIKGRDVSLNALLGDVVNERTVTTHQVGGNRRDYIDSAGRIEAGNDLTIGAGRDVMNLGGVIQAGRDLDIDAGRDLVLSSAEQEVSEDWGRGHQKESLTQHVGTIDAGRDITLVAERDFAAIASEVEAKRNIAVNAGNDLTLTSAANEEHFYSKTKKVTRQEDHVRQVSTSFKAGGNIDLSADNDLTLIASRIEAGDEAYLVAGDELALLAAEDRDYSLYDKKSNGSWGRKVTKRDESTTVNHVVSEISTGGHLTLVSSGDQRYQAAKLDSGGDLTLDSGGDIYFQSVKDLKQESHEKSDSSLAWFSMKGKGSTDETFRQTQMTVNGELVIKAAGTIHADVRQVNQESVAESIDAMVKADPNLGWLKEVEAKGGVDWRQVQEIHTRFKYENSGLGAGAQMVMAILLAAVLGPAGLGLAGAQLAGAAALANTALNSAISNKGDLGQVLKDTLSKESLSSAAIAAITAGIAENYFGDIAKTKIVDGKSVVDLGSLEGIGRFGAQQLAIGAASGAVGQAFGRDADIRAILQSAVFNTLAATAFSTAGDAGLRTGSPEKIALHALVGGFVAQAAGGDFATGAIAAGANEMLANQLRRLATQMDPVNRDALMLIASQLVGVVSAAARDEGDGKRLEDGSWIATNATQYNNLNHSDMSDFVGDMNDCGSDGACQEKFWVARGHKQLSDENYERALKTGGPAFARWQQQDIEAGLSALEGLKCTTTACQGYKDQLVERAVSSLQTLAEVTGSWEPFLQLIGELPGRKLVTERVLGVAEGVMSSPRVRAAVEKANEIKTVRKAETDALNAAKDAGARTIVGGKTCVYSCVVDGVTRYVGITDDIVKRGQAHMREKGIVIEQIPGLKNLSRSDARAVEQTLIEYHGLAGKIEQTGKLDSTLINKINSISKTKNPTKYERGLIRGAELLKRAGYKGF
ncbi:filamentous hemagglutinin N-terminal domain-containing protein [Pseudomonas fontis]|uniref:Filamentous hemagglutinin N-terminal domain-containing protein n=1 Tax=Pseudomonas fontis TaxID=2942633 RepID=A0ABT5NUZ7_9PSED|nr:filamentous hemagglutinin N-terminal domain-containing protein [Pseudomonas fontis]MDD0976807.1 filamentous hemagglutinin N-terminal domain-containing protein [Pseudomonas fontis]MDD0991969.1 filamentous hemagglutinin N-terminal domain-containing protein [Pseudomonas fontis]